jgi:hypothetical protein
VLWLGDGAGWLVEFSNEFAAANENDFAVEQIAQHELVKTNFGVGGDYSFHNLSPLFMCCGEGIVRVG